MKYLLFLNWCFYMYFTLSWFEILTSWAESSKVLEQYLENPFLQTDNKLTSKATWLILIPFRISKVLSLCLFSFHRPLNNTWERGTVMHEALTLLVSLSLDFRVLLAPLLTDWRPVLTAGSPPAKAMRQLVSPSTASFQQLDPLTCVSGHRSHASISSP